MDLAQRIHELHAAGDLRSAAAQAVEGYGAEVLGFLVMIMRDPADASEAFSQACEDLWTGIEKFERRGSIRAWFYALARNAAVRFRRSPHRRPHASLSEAEALAEQVRSRTRPYLRTEVKDRFAEIREALGDEERMLLVLRVDRELSWNEIAEVMCTEEVAAQGLARVAARLRKRFQLVKAEIRARAHEAGLFDVG